jgi:phosphatidylinositol alpha-1,6-mannosyltransferase
MVIVDHVTLAIPLLPLVWLRWCRLVVLAHGSEADDRMKRSGRWLFRAATKVLTNSQLTLTRLQNRLPDVRGEVCELGLSPDFALSDVVPPRTTEPLTLVACDGERRSIGPQALLLVARIDASEGEKGHAAVISALAVIRKRFPQAQAIFPGGGSGRNGLIEQAQKLQIADAVFFPGYVSTEMLKQLYGRCFAFVMPSRQEGFGLVYLEAMSFGLPCIGCRDDGAEEVIVSEETGLLIDGSVEIKELAAAIERLLERPEWARQLGANGFARLHARFTSAAHQQRIMGAVSRLMPS